MNLKVNLFSKILHINKMSFAWSDISVSSVGRARDC